MPLSAVEIAYQAIQEATADLDPPSSRTDKVDPILEPIWAIQSSCSHDCLNDTLPLEKAIIEAMSGLDRPWDELHQISYFLPGLEWIEQDEFRSTLSEIVSHTMVSLDTHVIYVEANMPDISPTVTINIS